MARKGLYLGGSALLLAVVLLLVFWGRPADAEIQVLKAPRAVVWKDFLGVNAQFLWFSPERYNKQIDRLQDLGLEWVRLDLHWDRLETAEDQYQLASLDQLVKDLEARQLKSVFYLVGSARFITTAPFYSPFQDQYPPRDPEVFARRMAMLSQRYPSVAAWQVWNEPNLIGFWRPKADPEGYAKLLQASTIALRMVDPKSARKLPRPVDQISGQHDAHLIPEGLPGAGNLLVFDNQGDAGYPSVQRGLVSGSRVLEIDPLKKQIVWQYTAEDSQQPGWAFYSAFISSARRLPNGNTLIDEGQNGRFFQVTPGGEIVWEYVSPYFGKAPRGDARSNWVYRALPVAYDWVPEGTPREEKAVNLAVPGATPQVTARR